MHETTFTHLRKPTEPYTRKSGAVSMREPGFTYLRQAAHPQNRQSVTQVKRKKPATNAGRLLTWVRKAPRRKAGRQGDVQSPLLRDQIRLCVPSSASTSRA